MKCRHVRRHGAILFVVTVVVALASLAAYGFLLAMQGESKASRTAADQLQVAQIAASGEEFMAVWLQASKAERRALAELHGNAVFSQSVSEPTLTAESTSAGEFHIVVPTDSDEHPVSTLTNAAITDTTITNMASTDMALPFRYGVQDESAKLHLATLLAWDDIWPGAGRNALLQLPGMNASIADAILDWIDADSVAREFGAEDEYYGSLSPPMLPLNRVPDSLDDLIRVRGCSSAQLHGSPVHMQAQLLSSSGGLSDTLSSAITSTIPSHDASLQNTSIRPWSNFITVYSAERNVAFDGTPRINVNNPDLAALHGELLRQLPKNIADFVVLYRQFGPATEVTSDGTAHNATSTDSSVEIAVELSRAPQYVIGSIAELIDTTIMAVNPSRRDGHAQSDSDNDDDNELESQRVASPFSAAGFASTSGSSMDLDRWLDRLTVGDDTVITGRLDILTASPSIIAGLPVPDSSIAAQILAMRQTLTWDATSVPGTSWLLTNGLLVRDVFLKLSPFLTTGGDVARFQIVATHPVSALVDRFEVILDGTADNTRRVFFRDLRLEGTPRLFDMFFSEPKTLAY